MPQDPKKPYVVTDDPQHPNGAAADAAQPYTVSDDDEGSKLSMRNLGRSLVQGATFNYGDELGLTDRDKEAAFKTAHPWIDAGLKIAGGAAAPIAAAVAAPEALAGFGGATALGAATGGLSASGESTGSLGDRAQAGAVGAGVGGVLGGFGYGLSKAAGAGISKLLDMIHPERPVARAMGQLVTPADVGSMNAINKSAPGTASLASASMPPKVPGVPYNPRLLEMTRAIGANPEAARSAEEHLVQQSGAITTAKQAIGAKMDALPQRLAITPQLRGALAKVRGVLGSGGPEVPPPPTVPAGATVPGFQPTSMAPPPVMPTDMSAAEARDALSQLRDLARSGETALALRGKGGVRMYDVKAARNALQHELYKQVPTFQDLDAQYSTMSQQGRNVAKLLNTVQKSRSNYSANGAYSASSGSLGGSLPSGRQGVALAAIDEMIKNRAGAADAVSRFAIKPGMDPRALRMIMKFAQRPSASAGIVGNVGRAATLPGLFSMLSPDDPQQPQP